jgi:two-component system OmpR family sensor kinase
VARAAVEATRAAAPDRKVTIDAPATPLDVDGDGARLRQVVTNLLDNAVAYSPPGSPVTVRVARVDSEGPARVAVEVTDCGHGLTPDQQARVFERFYRTDAARSRAMGGTGLGLSIVAAITAAHGGVVEVDSTPGEGSTFRVLLPAASPAGDPAPMVARAPGTGAAGAG